VGEKVVQDLNDSWPYVVGGLGIAMVACLIYIVLMRWIAGPMVWFSILGTIALLAYCKYSAVI
jgi:choline transporter-like protein 2/4/5